MAMGAGQKRSLTVLNCGRAAARETVQTCVKHAGKACHATRGPQGMGADAVMSGCCTPGGPQLAPEALPHDLRIGLAALLAVSAIRTSNGV